MQRPERRGREVEQMQAAFRSNLTALSAIALIAGMFLVYNTVSASVLTRRQEIGMLRAVGTSRSTVFALFLGEALCLALPGCALGLVIGRLLAQGAVTLTSRTVSRMYVSAAAAPPSLDAWHITLAFLVGIPLALIAAAAPAHEASRVPPTDAIRRAGHVAPASRLMRSIVAIASFALAAWLCTFDAIGGLPLAGYLACFFIVIGVTALTAPLLLAAAHVVRWAVHAISRRVFFVAPWLATNNLVEYARRMSVSVAALAVSLAMTVAIAVMVSSFRETVIYWVGQTLVADLYVGPAARRGGSAPGIVPAEVEAIVRAHPRVTAVDTFRVIDIPYQNARIFVGAGNFEALLSRNRLLFKAPARPLDAVRAAARPGRRDRVGSVLPALPQERRRSSDTSGDDERQTEAYARVPDRGDLLRLFERPRHRDARPPRLRAPYRRCAAGRSQRPPRCEDRRRGGGGAPGSAARDRRARGRRGTASPW